MSRLRPSTCALVSGGLDSAVLLHRLVASGSQVMPLYLRWGLSWEAIELYWLRRLLDAMPSARLGALAVLDVPIRSTYGAHWSITGARVPSAQSDDRAVYLPGRNVLLLTHAAILCAERHLTTIALGTLKGNPFHDATPRFFTQIARCLSDALDVPLRVVAPLRRFTKSQLIRSEPNVPFRLTCSCLRPRGYRHCGRCNKCAERQRAFREAGIPDPTRYDSRGS